WHDARKGKDGFSTKRAGYESPPDPPLSTSSSHLFLKKYCPRDRGNYKKTTCLHLKIYLQQLLQEI
ncbi:MAG: hypothetical protein RIM83_05425, partial [Allomuricauda sp.]